MEKNDKTKIHDRNKTNRNITGYFIGVIILIGIALLVGGALYIDYQERHLYQEECPKHDTVFIYEGTSYCAYINENLITYFTLVEYDNEHYLKVKVI